MSDEIPSIPVVGDAAAHFLTSRLPSPGVAFGTIEIALGGPAAVVAAQLALLGHRPMLCAAVGCDPLGELLTERLRTCGVGCERVRREGRTTRIVVGLERDEPWLAADTGVETEVADLDRLPPATPASDSYATAFPSHLATIRRMADLGHSLTVDAGFAPLLREPEELLRHLKNVASHARTIVLSASLLAADDRARVVDACLGWGATDVVLTDGAAPVVLHTMSGHVSTDVPQVVAVDTVCAGDVFVAGLLAARAEGCQGAEALRRASCLASAKVAMFGRLPGRSEVSAWA